MTRGIHIANSVPPKVSLSARHFTALRKIESVCQKVSSKKRVVQIFGYSRHLWDTVNWCAHKPFVILKIIMLAEFSQRIESNTPQAQRPI